MNSRPSAAPRKRSFIQQGKLHHHYHRRKGSYQFIQQNLIKLIVSILILGLGLFLLNTYVVDIDQVMTEQIAHLGQIQVLGLFFMSESFLGLAPPDLFIIWSKSQSEPWFVLFMLSILSYLGGQISFQIGRWINHIPRFHQWVHQKYENSLKQFQKFGALVIVLGALTPLPFSPISIISGSLEYSRKRYSLLALSRILRFFIYASLLYKL